jgi:SAM-dependent methyltransferase
VGIDEENARRRRARELAAQAAGAADETGWFERLYAEAETGGAVVPWADGDANPHLTEWASASDERLAGTGKRALVVGCGLGYDAEFLDGLGYAVTAFDVAPTAIERAIRENPGTRVSYVAADLLALPGDWAGAFDLVVEAYTVQPLYGPVRDRALAALHGPVAPGGTLLVIARATNDQDPARDPAMMPWALTRRELDLAGGPLPAVGVEQFFDNEDPPKLRWRAEFRRERAPGRMVLPGCGYGNTRGRRNERHVEMRTSGTSRPASRRSH